VTDETTGGVPGARAGAEAARLLAAAQDWLRTSAPHLAPVDADGEPCSCPLCRGVAAVREADPDQVGRWVDTAVATLESVLAQASSRVASAGADASGGTADREADPAPPQPAPDEQDGEPTRRVRRIPLDGTAGDG
jgi:hypothetical protein